MAPDATPARKSGELMQQLARLSTVAALDEVTIRRVERDAKALMKADPVGAHSALGGVAALRGRVDEVRDRFDAALRLADNSQTRFNYSVALSLVQEHDAALQVVSEALDRFPDDLSLLNQAILTALQAAQFRTARAFCDRWDTLSPDQAHPNSESVRQLAAAVDVGSFDEDAIGNVLSVVASLQRDAGVRSPLQAFGYFLADFDLSDGGAPRSCLHLRNVHGGARLASELNERLADELAERPDLMEAPGLTFTVAFSATGIDAGQS